MVYNNTDKLRRDFCKRVGGTPVDVDGQQLCFLNRAENLFIIDRLYETNIANGARISAGKNIEIKPIITFDGLEKENESDYSNDTEIF